MCIYSIKMHLLYIFSMSILLRIADGFTLKGSSGPLVVPLGGSVVLPCSLDSLLPLEDLEVEWRRSDSQTLIHLYQDEDIRPEAQHQDYHDRAHFFTEDIKHGNFSLRLDHVRTEDEGQYTCKVYSGHESNETVVEIKHVERLIVSGSSRSISASVGDDVTLSCSVNSHIKPEEIEEVSWRKTNKGEPITVLLYQYNETLPDASDERYRDRVEFFTDEIHRGNFSLRMKRVTTEDKGVYICQVFNGRLSANTTVIMERLGLSDLHILVLILCITACGSALLFCSLIYCRPNTGFIVEGYNCVHFGDAVVLPCFIDPCLIKEDLKVEWSKSGLESPVCVCEDGDMRPEVQHQDYHDRAHFLTEKMKHGDFSLLLKNLKKEDAGQYTCKVYTGQRSVFSVSVSLKHKVFFGSWFSVEHSSDLVVPLGGSVVLPCSVDLLLPLEDLKVEWRRSDLKNPLCVYQDEDIKPEAHHQDYHDRAHFFTEDIKRGNFSLLLNNLTAEDEGQYTCKVYIQKYDFSLGRKLVPRLLVSGFCLQMLLVFCPNLIMFFAFIFWGVSEGSVNEMICCCALYFLRPLTLLWAAPYINDFKDKIKTLILKCSYVAEYCLLAAVSYSVLLTSTWERILNYADFDKVVIIILYVILFLSCFCKFSNISASQIGNGKGRINDILDIVADLTFEILPTLKCVILFYTFASSGGGLVAIAVLLVLLLMANERTFYKCGRLGWSWPVIRTVWLLVIIILNIVMIGLYIFTLENETDPIGWVCVMLFLQILWTVVRFTDQTYYTFALDFHRFVALYVFGSVGVVLISAAALITELILKTVSGEHVMTDMRFIVFPSECVFILSVMISGQLASEIITCLQSCKTLRSKVNSSRRSQRNKNQDSQEDRVTLELLDQTRTQQNPMN
ncbi:uncharacterized protein [Paramisgurnus dabryanus]|uniref:uncharacterized protein isoform X2 n=1 Tax=Paramisgurnus dabryanus TaxID=90735 RepID=UPI0031F3B813